MRVLGIATLLTLGLDQALKWWIVVGLNLRDLGQIEVWPPYLTLTMAWNRGVNFGLLADDSPWLRIALIVLPLAVSVWVWRWVRAARGGMRMQLSAGLLIGGALGNAIDRIVWGAVADFLNMSCCGIINPWVFNVADVAIVMGAFGLIVVSPGKTPRDDRPGMR